MSSRKALLGQIGRFLVVCMLAFLVDYGTLWILVEGLAANYLVASAISFSVSVIFNYILSTNWVYDCNKKGGKAGAFVVFVLLSIGGLLLNLVIMWLSVDVLQIYYLIAKIGSTGIVMVYNFITRKLILEYNPEKWRSV